LSYQTGAQPQQKLLYQAEEQSVQSLKNMRNRLQHLCKHYVNHYVKIETMDGHVLVGRIVGCDKGFMYLAIPKHGGSRAFFNPFHSSSSEDIITLVLYELLVITLMLTA
jgi:hypothetical protein